MSSRTKNLLVRLTDNEKEGFELAASLAGISISAWVRERLRLTAIRELECAGRHVPFIPEIPLPSSAIEPDSAPARVWDQEDERLLDESTYDVLDAPA